MEISQFHEESACHDDWKTGTLRSNPSTSPFCERSDGQGRARGFVGESRVVFGGTSQGRILHPTPYWTRHVRGLWDGQKHTTKQLDRFFTYSTIDMEAAQMALADHVLKGKEEALIAVDWTEYDADDQFTLCAYLLTTHGRALPLVWETHTKSSLKGQRTPIELAFLERLNRAIRPELQVVIMADRGFGYQEFVQKLHELGLDFVLRVRNNLWVEDATGTRH